MARDRVNLRRNIESNTSEYRIAYAQALEVQDGKCAICSTSNKRLFLDHDHKTGVVRGLLCAPCNSGLGMFNDNPRLMAHALIYLEDHGVYISDSDTETRPQP